VKISGITGRSATLELDRLELTIINNALNEVCNGIDLKGEFDARIGATRENAQKLLKAINSLTSDLEN